MTIKDFIRENRSELDACILGALYRYDGNGGRGTIPPNAKLNDSERREWILNDESLYRSVGPGHTMAGCKMCGRTYTNNGQSWQNLGGPVRPK